MCGHTRSNALRSSSSALKPSCRNSRRKRPLCDAPKIIRRTAANRHVGAIAERRCGITDGGHPDADHLRAAGGVVDLVDAARLESLVEHDAHARVLRVEAPLLARDARRRCPELDRAPSATRCGRSRSTGRYAGRSPGDASVCFSSTMKEKRARPSTFAAGASILTKGGWTSNCQPTHTSVYPSFIRKPSPKSAAASRILTSVRAAIEAPQQSLAPAVGDLEQHRAVALLRVNRAKDVQVGGEVHAAIRAACRVLEIDDARVVLVGRIERELDRAGELLVRPDLPERLASGNDGSIGDRHLRDLGADSRRSRPGRRSRSSAAIALLAVASMSPSQVRTSQAGARRAYSSPASSNTVFAMTELSSSPRPAAIVACSSC